MKLLISKIFPDTYFSDSITYSFLFALLPLICYNLFVVMNIQYAFFALSIFISMCCLVFIKYDWMLLLLPLVLFNPYVFEELKIFNQISDYCLFPILLYVVLKQVIIRPPLIIPKNIMCGIIMLLVVSSLSLFWGVYIFHGLHELFRYSIILVFIFLIYVNDVHQPEQIRTILYAIVLGGIIASIIGVLQFSNASFTGTNTGRIFGWLGGAYGAAVGISLVVCMGIILNEGNIIIRSFMVLGAIILLVALLISQTRAWIVASIITLVFMTMISGKKQIVLLIISFLILIAFVFTIIQLGMIDSEMIRNYQIAIDAAFRFGNIQGQRSIDDTSLYLRLNAWSEGVKLFLSHPITGIGLGDLRFDSYLTLKLTKPGPGIGYIDNQYLNSFVETGVIGGVSWIYIIYSGLKLAYQNFYNSFGTRYQGIAYGILASEFILALGSFFWVITPHYELFTVLAIFWGLSFSLDRYLCSLRLKL
jgi:O-antigen ligase